MTVIVDTNVAIVASRASDELSEDESEDELSEDCVTRCAEWISKINNSEIKLALDDDRRIIDEYRRRLGSIGRFSLGYQFYKWVEINWTNSERCDLVPITPVGGLVNEFEEFPDDSELNDFHTKDRKFIAVARAHLYNPPILQAVDSKWRDFLDALQRNGVTIEYLCEDYMQ